MTMYLCRNKFIIRVHAFLTTDLCSFDSADINLLLTSCSGRKGSRWSLPNLTVPSNGRNLVPLATCCSLCTATQRLAYPSWPDVGARPNSGGMRINVSIWPWRLLNPQLQVQNSAVTEIQGLRTKLSVVIRIRLHFVYANYCVSQFGESITE
jgi:hypothetical protein